VTAGRSRRVVMIAVAVVSIAMVGPVLLSEVSTAAMASTRASVVSSTTRPVRRVVKRRRHRTIVKRKRSVRKVVTSTTTTTTSSSTTSTTSTTVAGGLFRSNGRRGAGLRRRAGSAIATRPVSARHSGITPLTVILVLLGIALVILFGFGLVLADVGSRSTRPRHPKSAGFPL
jgi:hypothetical protein